MFERKTVFVLGAGASWHYNYPTGDDLVQCVLEKLKILIRCYDDDWGRHTKGGPGSAISSIDAISKIMGGEAENPKIVDFLQNFHDRLKYVNPPVIDYFFQSNDDLRDIGKLMIAWAILDRESQYERVGNFNRERLKQSRKEHRDDWYRYVLYKMLIGCNDYNDVFENNVNFITFNYDVSLDHFLYKGLKQIAFMKPDSVPADEIKRQLKRRIHHVYGFVREKDPFSDLDISFEPPNSSTIEKHKDIVESAYAASQSIDTIAGLKRDIPKHVLNKLEEAQDIYVLGFGFDEMNCESLNAREYFGFNSSKQYIADKDYRNFFFTNYSDCKSITKKVHKVCGFPDRSVFFSNWGDVPYESYGSLGGEGRGTGGVRYEKSTKNVYDAISQDFNFV